MTAALSGWAKLDPAILAHAKRANDPMPIDGSAKLWLPCADCDGDGEHDHIGLTDTFVSLVTCDSCAGTGGWEVEPYCAGCLETRPLNSDGECSECARLPETVQ
jgi:hypothetical protein